MLFKEITAVYCESHAEQIHALCSKNTRCMCVYILRLYIIYCVMNIIICAIYLNFRNCTLPTQCICVLRMILTINSDYFLKSTNLLVAVMET
jgi:hypothetical protein